MIVLVHDITDETLRVLQKTLGVSQETLASVLKRLSRSRGVNYFKDAKSLGDIPTCNALALENKNLKKDVFSSKSGSLGFYDKEKHVTYKLVVLPEKRILFSIQDDISVRRAISYSPILNRFLKTVANEVSVKEEVRDCNRQFRKELQREISFFEEEWNYYEIPEDDKSVLTDKELDDLHAKENPWVEIGYNND